MSTILDLSHPINFQHPLNKGLIGCWAMLPYSYTNARVRDQLNRNHMTVGSGTKPVLLGPTGRAMRFSNSNLQIPATTFVKVDGVGKITVAVWIYMTAISSYMAVFDSPNRDLTFMINTVNDGYIGAGGTANGITFSTPFTTDEWQHVIFTYDPASPSRVRIYRNGIEVGSNVLGNAVFTDAVVFGTNPSGGGSNFQGMQAGWRIWNRTFTAKQCYELYKEARKGYRNLYSYLSDPVGTPEQSAFILSASNGSFTLSGQAATLTFAPAAAYTLSADNGAFTISGQAATLTYSSADAFTLTADNGSFAINGQAATLTFTGATAYTLSADYGSFTLTGSSAILYTGSHLGEPVQQIYLGSFRRGQKLSVFIGARALPDQCPVVDFWHEAATKVKTASMPLTNHDHAVFGVDTFLDSAFPDGHYVAVITYDIDANASQHYQYFTVTGGEAIGQVIAIAELRRPLGRAIVTHLDDGTVHMAYRPRLE